MQVHSGGATLSLFDWLRFSLFKWIYNPANDIWLQVNTLYLSLSLSLSLCVCVLQQPVVNPPFRQIQTVTEIRYRLLTIYLERLYSVVF